MGAAVTGYAAILLTESSTPFRLQGTVVILSGALGAWILAAHMRVSRVRVVQVLVEPARLTFGRPRGILLPLRLLGICGGFAAGGLGLVALGDLVRSNPRAVAVADADRSAVHDLRRGQLVLQRGQQGRP